MAQDKGIVLETVVEDLEGENGDFVNKSTLIVKSADCFEKAGDIKTEIKTKKKKTVIVEIPSENSEDKTDTDNKIGYTDEKSEINDSIPAMPGKDNSTLNVLTESEDNKNVKTTANNEASETDTSVKKATAKFDIYREFTRTDTNRSLLSTNSEGRGSSKKTKSEKKLRPKSSNAFSKRDMELFLPRKSFFNSHDKVLKDAGHHIDNTMERKKPNWRSIMRMHTMDELYPPVEVEEEADTKKSQMFDEEDDEEDDEFSMDKVETAMSSGKDGTQPKRKVRASKKALPNDKEEYRPLYEYLKHIHDNPDEYIHMTKYTAKNNDHRHPSRLVRMGRVYRRGHHGTVKNSMYLHALSGLKYTDTTSTTTKPSRVLDKLGSKKDQPSESADGNTADDSTEIEKLKTKTEKWMRGLTTFQIMKAKEMALKDIGEEDVNVSKWWHSLKACKYLRHPQYADSSSG